MPELPLKFPKDRIPETDADKLDWLRLSRSANVGPVTFATLMNRYMSAGHALAALPELARRGGAKRKFEAFPVSDAKQEVEAAEKADVKMLCLGADDYPETLVMIHDAPPFLWMRGTSELFSKPALAIVGARNTSAVGWRMAKMLARDMAQHNYVIVSGLARGIDSAAHEATIETGTIAAVAGGVDAVYPPENAKLFDAIAENGAILSERPMGYAPQGRDFPRRNRIISGLSRGVLLIEAAEKSGSLITARYALEQGREAMAVPGSPLDARASGCNGLIRQGAALIRNADDILEAIGYQQNLLLEPEENFTGKKVNDTDEETLKIIRKDVTRLMGPSPTPIDDLVRITQAHPSIIHLILLEFDLAGRLNRHAGAMVSLLPAEN